MPTRLYDHPYELPAADIGPENPLPAFRGAEDDGKFNLDPKMPEEDRRYLGWRTARRVLPYRIQDGYNREKRPQALRSIVLENERLRAVFLPHAGGRLVSMVDKTAGRELLTRNPVFQPANLALRNAWFSGGIEWNPGGPPGHHYLTCSPVFASRIEGPKGEPGLRLYEWDRVGQFPWQIDFHLPADSPFLFAHVRLANPHDHEIPMYWWTNIAVDERPDVRVLVPAESVLCHAYRGQLEVVELPNLQGRDMSYATNLPHAFDFFSRIPDDRRKWVAALDRDGRGLFQTSTDRLRGRKLFCWGMAPGGRHWQEFLAEPGCAYIEIQAGLARTQMERIPMPAGAVWEWTEAFGLLSADPARVHGADWSDAWRAAGEAIDRLLPRGEVDAMHTCLTETANRPPVERLTAGSGWAALEGRRLAAEGACDAFPAALPFEDEMLGAEQRPWLTLLESGVLPEGDPQDDPGALMIQPEWEARLRDFVQTAEGGHWLAWWHLGNMRMEARDLAGAEEAWNRSVERRQNAWALRNLAVLESRRERPEAACDYLGRAWEIGPKIAPLAVDYGQALADLDRWHDLLELIRTLPDSVREHERVLLLWAKAALGTGDLEGVERVFDHEYATIREGELTLTDLWFVWQERRLAAVEGLPIDESLRERVRRELKPPRGIDFRMSE